MAKKSKNKTKKSKPGLTARNKKTAGTLFKQLLAISYAYCILVLLINLFALFLANQENLSSELQKDIAQITNPIAIILAIMLLLLAFFYKLKDKNFNFFKNFTSIIIYLILFDIVYIISVTIFDTKH